MTRAVAYVNMTATATLDNSPGVSMWLFAILVCMNRSERESESGSESESEKSEGPSSGNYWVYTS